MYDAHEVVTTEDEIRAVIEGEFESQIGKIIDHIDDLCGAWIERSTFLTLATVSADGKVDVSPKGDPAGFVKVLDEKTLAIPDRPGNHRFDSLRNILETGRIGLVFLVPNRNEVVRVNGGARLVRDLAIRELMAIKGRVPEFAILVDVEEAFYHCGKAVIRSQLWAPEKAEPVDGLPTYGEALVKHGHLARTVEAMQAVCISNEETRLYDE